MKSVRISCSDISYLKGEVLYLHDGKDIGSGAFEKKEKAQLKILLPRSAGAVSLLLKLYNSDLEPIGEYDCKLVDYDLKYDVFLFNADVFSTGLYFFSFKIKCAAGVVWGMKSKGTELYFSPDESGERFQLSVVDFKYDIPEEYRGGIIYHIFVDRFARGGEVSIREDAIMINDWENGIPEYPEYPGAHLENNTFFGGTLFGVIEKLDYIKSLGVNLIYLSPVFEAYSNHKYDTGNYMKVDDMFGGDEALARLISEARSRGIGIILDGVFNHTGSDSVYFNCKGRYSSIGAYQSKKSPYYKWYDFQSYPDKYTGWWGIEILPRINPEISECGNFIAGDGGVIEKYSKLGIAGFRLDVADELSDEFISKIKAKLAERKSPSILYGEVWEDASNKIAYDKRKKYYLGNELDGVMNYPLRTGIISFLKDKNKSALEYALTDVTFNAPKRIRDMQMNLLGTHDTERLITMLSGASAEGKNNSELAELYLNEEQRENGERLVMMAYAILATVPGIPSIFYGDEVGLEGYKDPFNRRPYPWKSGNTRIRSFYKKIGKIRKSSDVYAQGAFKLMHLDNERLIFARGGEHDMYITAINNSNEDMILLFDKAAYPKISGESGRKFVLPPMSAQILKTTTKNNMEII